VTGPEAVALLRARDAALREAGTIVRRRPEEVVEAVQALADEVKALRKAGSGGGAAPATEPSPEAADRIDGAVVLVERVDGVDPKALRDLADRLRGRLGDDAVVVLGAAAEDRVHLVATVSPQLIARGVKAGAIVRAAAQVAGGGGGGKDTMAQAGGKDPAKLGEALDTARSAIAAALGAAG
jgi:alanyl-tRNA synthetase